MTFVFVSHQGKCQQHPLFTQYMFNGLLINPAYAGSQESLSLSALVRKQWVGIEGAPSTQTFSAHTPLRKEKISLGLILMNDYIGVSHTYSINGIYAYRITMKKGGHLSAGIQTGVTRVHSELSSLPTKDPNDPAFASDLVSPFMLSIGAGLYYYTHKFYTGLSVPNLMGNSMSKFYHSNVFPQKRHYLFTTGYVFNLSPNLKMKPSTLVKLIEGSPLQVDLNTNFLIKDVLWVGCSYRSFSSLNFIAQIQVSNQMTIGYSYDNGLSKFHSFVKGAHEIALTYNFKFFSSKVVSPRHF
jgi:type IX secretion system PorP/SprF family membrane protein